MADIEISGGISHGALRDILDNLRNGGIEHEAALAALGPVFENWDLAIREGEAGDGEKDNIASNLIDDYDRLIGLLRALRKDVKIALEDRVGREISITWRLHGSSTKYVDDVDVGHAEFITDDGGSLGASIVKLLFEKHRFSTPGWSEYERGEGPCIEILSPADHAGVYAVSASKNIKNGRVVFGSRARKLEVLSGMQAEEALLLFAESTPPDAVQEAYDFLGNIYGHEIGGALTDEENSQLELLRDLYNKAVLHDRGWPVRCRASGRIGFLAYAEIEDGDFPDPDTKSAFRKQHGCAIQTVSNWQGRDVKFLVCFVPISKVAKAGEIYEALLDAAGSRPSLPGTAP